MLPEIDNHNICLTKEQLSCANSDTEKRVKWLNKFIWFTDMYICFQPLQGSVTVQLYNNIRWYFSIFPNTSLALKIKTTRFLLIIRKKVSLYTILVWQEIAHSQYITSVIINIELSTQRTFTPKGIGAKSTKFGKVKTRFMTRLTRAERAPRWCRRVGGYCEHDVAEVVTDAEAMVQNKSLNVTCAKCLINCFMKKKKRRMKVQKH